MNRRLIVERTLKLYVAALSDAADAVGLTQVCMDSGIVPLTLNRRMAGFARTGKMIRSAVQKPYDELHLETFMILGTEAKRDDVLVLDSAGAKDCSVWGQVVTKISLAKGVRGAVVDGTSRDIDEIDKLGFPVFARGRHPGTMRARLDMESVGKPVACGGVPVNQGDLVFCDGDGVVVIPQARIDEVLAAAEEVASTDTWWSKKLDEGRDPHELHREKPIP
jgi:regulator of RNase E activity RraA